MFNCVAGQLLLVPFLQQVLQRFVPAFEVLFAAQRTVFPLRELQQRLFVGIGIYHSGDTSLIDPVGEIIYRKEHDEDVFTYTLSRQHLSELRARFPFMKDADKFVIL